MNHNDPQLVWVAILDAAQEHHEAELADIAISLYGELGEARAEISRLRAALQTTLPSGQWPGRLSGAGAPGPLTARQAAAAA